MNTRIQALCADLQSVYDGDPWYGNSLVKILEGIEAEQALRRIGAGHSILQILKHIIAWRTYTVEKLRANKEFVIQVDSEADWVQQEQTPDDWRQAVEKFHHLHQEIIAEISTKDDTFWEQPVAKQKEDTLFTNAKLIQFITQHDIYHAGQIALLKRM